MSIQSTQDLKGMTLAGRIVGETLNKMMAFAKPGMSTKALDDYGYEILKSHGANPAPNKEYGFPGWNCISVNHEVAHGIPSQQVILKEGDLVNIDVSAEVNGYYGDNGASFILGKDTRQLVPLVNSSKEILYTAIDNIRGGVKIAAIGALIENEAKKRGLTTIKNLVGHGIGLRLHDHPHEIPCFADRTNKFRFRKNTVIALETFISTNARMVTQSSDGWTFKTTDGSFVAQHEHTLIVTDDYPVILTSNNGV